MTTARWQRIQALFHEALEQAPAQRTAFLGAECAGDAALREEVETLLEADADAPPILDTRLEELACLLPEEEEAVPRPCPSHIGPYKLVRELGRGGMGTVYLAERADIGRRVALKVLRDGLRSSSREQRFLSERRILARLTHPNIARLLDAGVTAEGTPYFAMEYVEGEPIDRYADAHRLTIRERLALFQTVCEAVQYAHRNLLVHRDLKPSNILVAEDEHGRPLVKLLDFGIAKLLAEDATDTPQTRTGLRPMTPEYAAPEQVRGEAATTATDVYALGVLLYELLTGQRPYRVQGQGAHALEQVIREVQPERPSLVVCRAGLAPRSLAATDSLLRGGLPVVTPEAVSRARRTPVDKLHRQLRGDLDNIALMALRKEPDRRYPAAAQLLKDVERHLKGLPVEAQQDTLLYRTGKFVRRHPWGVSASAVATAVFLASIALFTASLQEERDRARLEAAKSAELADVLINLFDASDPFSSASVRTDTMQVRDFLANRAMMVTELEADPKTRARILSKVAQMHRGIGLHDQADTLSREALADARAAYPQPHPELADVLNERADLLRLLGGYDEAEPLLREALEIRRALEEEERGESDVSQTLNSLAGLLREKGDYDEAEAFYREALEIRRERLPDTDPKMAESMNHLASVLYDQGDLAGAEPLLRQALAIYRLPANAGLPQMADVLDNLGFVTQDRGDLEEAKQAFDEALELKNALLGDDNWRVADGLVNLARVHRAQGNLEAAEGFYWEAAERQQQQLGADHWRVASILIDISSILHERGDLDRAERLYRKALDAFAKTYPEGNHPRMAEAQLDLGRVLTERGEALAGRSLIQQALGEIEATFGPLDWRTAEAHMALGACLVELGRYDEAERLLVRSHARLRTTRGLQDPLTLQAEAHLAALYEALGQPGEPVGRPAALR